MVQARLEMPTQQVEKREIAHAINNRMNTISLSAALLERNNDPDVRLIANTMKSELRDLESLIRKLRTQA